MMFNMPRELHLVKKYFFIHPTVGGKKKGITWLEVLFTILVRCWMKPRLILQLVKISNWWFSLSARCCKSPGVGCKISQSCRVISHCQMTLAYLCVWGWREEMWQLHSSSKVRVVRVKASKDGWFNYWYNKYGRCVSTSSCRKLS